MSRASTITWTEAKRLTALLKDMQGHVNLIPVNPIKERDFKQSNRDAIDAFKGYLEKHGINVTIRPGGWAAISAAPADSLERVT